MAESRYIPKIELSRVEGEALHLHLSRLISDDIFRHRPGPGRTFASERQLAEKLMLNRGTVHRAYTQLMNDGILCRSEGGRMVCIAPHALDRVTPPFPSIGIILPYRFSEFVSGGGPTPLKYLSGIFDRAAELGYAPMPLLLPAPETPADEVRDWLKNILPRLTAMIHLGDRAYPEDVPLGIILHENYLPQIFISGYSTNPRIGTVCCDFRAAFTSLVCYLKEKGHHRLGIVGETFRCSPYFDYTYSHRTECAVEEFRRNGMDLRDEWIIRIPQFSSPFNALAELCKKDMPSVIWCSNDFTAERVYNSLKKLGIRVPGDISLVGADDIGIAEKMEIPLTTLKVPMYAIGRAAVDLAVEQFYDGMGEANRSRLVPATLVMRDSVRKQSGETRYATNKLSINQPFNTEIVL